MATSRQFIAFPTVSSMINKNIMKFFKPIKRKKGMIDLTSIGAQEQHEEAIARIKAQDLAVMLQDECGDLIQLTGAPEVKNQPPSPYVRPEVNWWEVILSAPKRLISIMKP